MRDRESNALMHDIKNYLALNREGIGGQSLEREKPFVYQSVRLITPTQAGNLGLFTEHPVFVRLSYKGPSIGDLKSPSIYEPGGIVTADQNEVQNGGIFAFSNLKTAVYYESVGYYGFVPFTGFIAVGESELHKIQPVRSPLSNDLIRTPEMRVFGMRAFVDEREVTEGYVREQYFNGESYLSIGDSLERSIGRDGQIKYSFKISEDGKVIFGKPKVFNDY